MVRSLPIQDNQPRDITFSTNSMPFDLSVDTLSSNAISINSVGELEGLLGTSIDVSSIMGGGLVTQLGIAGSTFPDGFGSITPSTEGEIFQYILQNILLITVVLGMHLLFVQWCRRKLIAWGGY